MSVLSSFLSLKKMLCSSSIIVFILPSPLFALMPSLSRGPSDILSCWLSSCFSLCSFILVFDSLSSYHGCLTLIPYDFVFQVDFSYTFIRQLSRLSDLHLLIPISVSQRNDHFYFDFANHPVWLLHLQDPLSWLPPPHLICDNAPTWDQVEPGRFLWCLLSNSYFIPNYLFFFFSPPSQNAFPSSFALQAF